MAIAPFKAESAKEKVKEVAEVYKSKIEGAVLPPDPLRIVEFIMRAPVTIEHLLPIPPILETVHSDVVQPLVESLPRLPLTADFPMFKFKEWIKEEI